LATFTITDDVLNSASSAEYFETADRRTLIGLRYTLEILGIPLPQYALRRPPGRTPARDVMRAFATDYPLLSPTTLAPRKEDATPDRIAAVRAANATRLSRVDPLSL
jgi:hypothetical protein